MKVKCSSCELEDIGRYNKLIKKGWKIFFLFDGVKVIRCKKCKPNAIDKIKKVFNKNYKSGMYQDVEKMMNKLKLLKQLKTKEELINESMERRRKQQKKYHYQRNIHKEKGSKSMGLSSRRIRPLTSR
jgi:hypothetical protein